MVRWLLRRDILGVTGRASGSDVQQPGSASWFPSTDARGAIFFLGIDHFGGRSTIAKECRVEVTSHYSPRSYTNEFFKLTHWLAPGTNPVTCQRLSALPKAVFYG